MKNCRAVSGVVVSVLLIVISVAAVGMIASFIIPMIKSNLEEGATCFELLDYVSVVNSEYTCYSSEDTRVMIERGMKNYSISEIDIRLVFGGKSKTIKLEEGMDGTSQGVKMFDGSTIISLPGFGGAETYIFTEIADATNVELGIVSSNKKLCEMGKYNINRC
ncbi:MAG: hypothetical protein KJ559_03410 [Nanoarchaeota archaeon]|nr:hypothetical protein [Nanoarchaeota archaeon]